MQVFKKNLENAVDILGDMLLNSLYREAELQAEKSTILQELEEVNKDPLEVLLENSYFTAYPEHMMGQPILGDRENIRSVTRDMVTDFHAANYFGENMIIVGTGDINHKELVDLATKHFEKCERIPPEGIVRTGMDTPTFSPGLTMIRDDEMDACHVGVFYKAPSWNHADYYPFLLLERLFGTFNPSQNFNRINTKSNQYNAVSAFIGQHPGIARQQAIYSPYHDCGLFGNYLTGSEDSVLNMNYCGLHFPTKFSDYIDDVEVSRAKQKVYTELASLDTTADIMQTIGQQVLYWNRRVPSCEIAKAISNITTANLKRICYEWFYDAVIYSLLL